VAAACRLIEAAEETPNLASLAESVGASAYHFHRVFKAHTGLTPRAYAAAHRARRARNELLRCPTVTEAIYRSGFSSSGRFYESAASMLGMKPNGFRSGGSGMTIRYAIGECWLGPILVAATEKGVCAISLGEDREKLTRELQDRFPNARLISGDTRLARWIAKVVAFLETPSLGLELPLDIRGTAFQHRVWNALRDIPTGSTATYTQIAQRIGRPKSARAVANACAANPMAVAIPCHRVLRSDGSISGYRWGVERKRRLLQREQETR
jgi:AraC family transcriptional regulator of adaptative response/methylated-DNA-[protein]-cysteine methyltransferase